MSLSPETFDAVWIILSLIVIEGLLSVDNALAIAALASHLPEKQRYLALKLGIIGAYVFRGVALLIANWIIHNPWLKLAGAIYLIYLMCSHLGHSHEDDHPEGLKLKRKPGLWMTVIQIELMDLSLSIDNVVAAVVMSPRFWVVFTGVAIGILALRFLAGYAIKLLEKYPILKDTAFVLVGYVGLLLVFELTTDSEVHAPGKFSGIILIVVLTILYSRQPALQRALKPVLAFSRVLMRLFAGLFDILLLPITWPFHKLAAIFSRESEAADRT
jgi:tellurite resistance protein TerC